MGGCVGFTNEGAGPDQSQGDQVDVTSDSDDPTRLWKRYLLHEAGMHLPALSVEGAAEAIWQRKPRALIAASGSVTGKFAERASGRQRITK